MKSYLKQGLGVYILAIIILLLAPVDAAPPVTTVQPFSQGLIIEYPAMDFLKLESMYEFNFHVYNISNGKSITTASCYFHLYNSTGNHIYEGYDEAVSYNFDYAFDVDGNNFTDKGVYYYLTQCNTSALGGYIDHGFEVNAFGKEFTTAHSILDSLIYFFSLALFITLIIFSIVIPAKNKTDEMSGYILAVSNLKYLKVVCFGLAYLMAVFLAYFSWMMCYAYTNFGFVSEMFRVIFTIFAALIVPLFVLLAYIMIANAVRDSKIADALSRGLSYKDDD